MAQARAPGNSAHRNLVTLMDGRRLPELGQNTARQASVPGRTAPQKSPRSPDVVSLETHVEHCPICRAALKHAAQSAPCVTMFCRIGRGKIGAAIAARRAVREARATKVAA